MQLKAKTVSMRLVVESDAEFILSLRTDEKYNKHLSHVSGDLDSQIKWITKYKVDEKNKKQFYFIIERNDGVKCGTVRVYDLKDESFSWGSWILNESKTRYAAIESAFLVYKFGFDELGFDKCHFEVRKGNDKVVSFHEKMGALKVSENDAEYFFEISKSSVLRSYATLQEKLGL